jgi:hypothetical protein
MGQCDTFVMNLAKLLQVAEKWKGSFALLLKKLKTAIKNLLRLESFDKNLLLVPIANSYGAQKISRPYLCCTRPKAARHLHR